MADFTHPSFVYSGPLHQNFGMKLNPKNLETWGYCMVKIA